MKSTATPPLFLRLGDFWIAFVAVLVFVPRLWSQSPINDNQSYAVVATLQLHANVEVPGNLLTLSDLVTIKAANAWKDKLAGIPMGTVPISGKIQTLNQLEIQEILSRRGFHPSQFRWEGSQQCRVSRSVNSSKMSANPVQQASTLSVQPTPQDSNGPITTFPIPDKSRFTPANTSPATVLQAERVITQALTSYLQTKANADTHWKIRPKIPPELAPRIAQRRQILGITGGQAPWDGEQLFEFLIKGPEGEYTLSIAADIQLPDLVIASSKQLAKGHLLTEDDLVHIPLPRDIKNGVEECFTDIDELIGKELKRALSMNQAIRKTDAGTETLIQAGDAIRIVVLAGDVAVESNGRALQSGGKDELIQVEEADYKGRFTARVTGPRAVEVNSQGNSIKRQANNNRPSPSRIRK